MTFDPTQYKFSTRQQWQDYASGWNEIESALIQCETPNGFAGATR